MRVRIAKSNGSEIQNLSEGHLDQLHGGALLISSTYSRNILNASVKRSIPPEQTIFVDRREEKDVIVDSEGNRISSILLR